MFLKDNLLSDLLVDYSLAISRIFMGIADRTVLAIVVAIIRAAFRTIDNIIDKFESDMISDFGIERLKLLNEIIRKSID